MILAVIKTAGIVLLILVIIFLIIGALILFLPIRYRVSGDLGKKRFSIRVNWMFHMIRLIGEIGDGVLFELRLLFFKIKLYPRDKEKDALKKKRREERKRKKQKKKSLKAKRKREKAKKREHNKDADYDVTEASGGSGEEAQKTTDGSSKEAPYEGDKETGKLKKAAGILKKIRNIIREGNTTEVLALLAGQAKYLLIHYRPRKIHADITFGLTNPATTGQILGAISMAGFLFAYDIQVDPVFETEETVLEGEFEIQGHIQIIYLVISFIRLIRVKDFRNFIKIIIKQIRKK